MLDHIGINVSDYAAAREFYGAALAMEPLPGVGGFATQDREGQGAFPLWLAEGRGPVTTAHVAITAPDRAAVDAFHAAAVQAGGIDNGPPGVREIYHPDYYGAYVLDPDGNNIEAVCHTPA